MRVITGSARGRNLETLAGEEVTRPTTQATKEALFSSIQFEIEDRRILDLFAGSGQLGIEALSRGARVCTFVENNRQAYKIVEGNVNHCKMQDKSNIVLSDAKAFLCRKERFDVAFVDPPYDKGLTTACLPLLTECMDDDGVIVCETSNKEELPESVNGWSVTRAKKYGKAKLTYYRKDSE